MLNRERFHLSLGIGFLFYHDVRMVSYKVFVIKRNIADDTENVGNNTKFENIAKMTIDIESFFQDWQKYVRA